MNVKTTEDEYHQLNKEVVELTKDIIHANPEKKLWSLGFWIGVVLFEAIIIIFPFPCSFIFILVNSLLTVNCFHQWLKRDNIEQKRGKDVSGKKARVPARRCSFTLGDR